MKPVSPWKARLRQSQRRLMQLPWWWVRPLLVAAALLGAVVFLARFVNDIEPLKTWLFWPYAGFWAATMAWVISCLLFGHAALRLLPNLGLRFRERLVFDFATGVLLFAIGLFTVGLFGLLRSPFYYVYPLVLGLVGAVFSFRDARRAWRHFRGARRRAAVRPTIVQHGALMLATVGLGIVYLTIMVPENVAFDARSYHLPIAEHFASGGRVARFPEGWLGGALPHLASWLYTWPFTLNKVNLYGHIELAAHLEFSLFVATILSAPVLVEALCPGRRARGTWAVFFLFPGLFLYDSSLGIAADHVLAFWAAPLALAVRRYVQRPADPGRGSLTGLMLAGAALTKYQSIYLLVPAGLLVALAALVELIRRRSLRSLAGPAALLLTALAASAPHWLANVVWHGNPVFPLARNIFTHSHPVVPGWQTTELDHQFELTGTLAEKLRRTFTTVFTFSFVPNDWWTFHRNVPVFGFLFTLTLPILVIARAGWRAFVLALGAMMGVFIWYWTYHEDRYLQAIVPWMVVCTAIALWLAWNSGFLARVGVALLVGLQLVWGATVPWLPTHAMLNDVPALRSLRLLSSTFRGDLIGRLSFETGYAEVNKLLPKDAYVLLHEEYLRLGLKRRAIQDSLRLQAGIDYRYLGRPDRVHDMMKTLGATHLVWNPSVSPAREVPLAGEMVFWDYALNYGQEQTVAGGFRIAKVPANRPPARELGPVTYVGCNVTRNLKLSELDKFAAAPGAPDPVPIEPATLIPAADFIVAETSCQYRLPAAALGAFQEGAHWGGYSLFVRRR